MISTLKKHFPWIVELIRTASKMPSFRWCYHRRTDSLDVEAGTTTGIDAEDSSLIDRLVHSYRLRNESPSGH